MGSMKRKEKKGKEKKRFTDVCDLWDTYDFVEPKLQFFYVDVDLKIFLFF